MTTVNKEFSLFFDFERQVKTLGKYTVMTKGKKGVCLDIGACYGAFAEKYYDYFDVIYAIEPCYSSFLGLCRKDIPNMHPLNFAVDKTSGSIEQVRYYKGSPQNVTVMDDKFEGNFQFHHAMTISLPDLLGYLNLTHVDYMKVDAEGKEYDFLIHQDLSCIAFLGIEVHFVEKEKGRKLKSFLESQFHLLATGREGTHAEFTFVNKNVNLDDYDEC